MFKYYNYKLIESNRSHSTEKIQKLLGIHPQTIREWINRDGLECISKKPISIYGAVLKEFIKNRNEIHKKTLSFNEMKCFKCDNRSIPKDNHISIYHNKNGSIRVVGICPNCKNEFSKLYKKNAIDELQKAFFIKPTESTLYNTSHISIKTHIESQNERTLNESSLNSDNNTINPQTIIANNVSCKTHIKTPKTSTKTHITQQQTLFDFDYD
jgi:hypothetical protein